MIARRSSTGDWNCSRAAEHAGNFKMETTIRVADKKDIEELRDLYQQLVEHEYSLDLPYKDMLKPFSDRLNDMITRLDNLGTDKDTWFVACVENKPIGCIRVRKVTPFSLDREAAEILDVIVDKNFRNRDVGNRLMLRAFQWAKDNNLSGAMLGVMEHNYGARKFYEKLGMYTTGRTLVKDF